MKTREDIISAALLKEPHPKYGFLDFGKWTALNLLQNRMLTEEPLRPEDIGEAWVVCTLGDDHEIVQKAIQGEKDDMESAYKDGLHPSEMKPFMDWYDSEWLDAEAAATVDKKSKTSGKS